MNTPYHLLTSSATVSTPTYAQAADGSEYVTSSASVTVQCTIQPSSNSDSLRYMRETGVRRSTMYMAPLNTAGSATGIDKNAVVVSGGITYRVVGGIQDSAGKGALYTAELEEVA